MPSEASLPIELAGPFTPRKWPSNSPIRADAVHARQPTSLHSQATGTHPKPKPRDGNQTRAKQASSPRPPKHGQTTPPQTAAVPKAIAVSAFAGATFHASPAPSSLPIPSFLAKAPGSPSARKDRKDTDRISGEPSPPATDSEAPTPQHRVLKSELTLQESPLDIFFRADRAEKERVRRASSANILGSGSQPIPFSPPAQIRSPREPKTLPRESFGAGNRRHGLQRMSSTGIPVSELDGTPGTAVGPAFSKPYQDRIRAARAGEKRDEPMEKHESHHQSPATVDATEKLKRFLAIQSVPERQELPSQVPADELASPSEPGFGFAFHPAATSSQQVGTASIRGSISPGLSELSPPCGAGSAWRQPSIPNRIVIRRPERSSQPMSSFTAANVSGPESPQYMRRGISHPSPGSDSRSFIVTPASANEPATPSSHNPPSSAVSTTSVMTEPVVSRAPEILHMEDSLRRLLKLKISSNPAPPTDYQSS
jgi:hypothetical protein